MVAQQPSPTEWRPPANVEMEQALLGAILTRNDLLHLIDPPLDPDDFYEPIHRDIFRLARDMIIGNRPADPLTIGKYFGSSEVAPGVTIRQYMGRLISSVTRLQGASEYAAIIRDLARVRRVHYAMLNGLERLQSIDPSESSADAVQRSVGEVVAASASDTRSMRTIGDWAGRAVDAVAARYKAADDGVKGLSTGIAAIDALTGEFQPKCLYVLAALSSGGKSALVQQMVEAFARREAQSAQAQSRRPRYGLLLSLEMMGEQYGGRALARETMIQGSIIDSGLVNEDEFYRLSEARDRMAALPIMIDDQPRLTMTMVRAKALQVKHRYGLSFIALDHILLVKPENQRWSLAEKVAHAAQELKALAKDLEVPVIALAQLKDTVYERSGGVPQVDDLFGGREIEFNADTIMFLHRPSLIHARKKPADENGDAYSKWLETKLRIKDDAEIIIAKRRGGARNVSRKLKFDGPTMTFSDL
jgi:replicative DNA helicase